MRKRIYSILLTIALLATIIPITVLAEDPPHTHNGYTPITTTAELDDLFENGGSGYLANDVTANVSGTAHQIAEGKTVNLCLNGYTLKLNGNNLDLQNNSRLNIYDCDEIGRESKFTDDNGIWRLAQDGAKTISGGIITGGSNTYGGAFFVNADASLHMYGGTIVGNYSSTYGGGAIYLYEGASSFNMHGGTIIGNKSNVSGGAVFVSKSATLNVDGGTISNNAAVRGGGVYVAQSGTFTMNGGTITGNTSTNDGAGVYIDQNGSFIMNSGTISTNKATANGGGIFVHNATFTMSGGTISGNTGVYGGGVCGLSNIDPKTKITMNGGEISGNIGEHGGGVHVNGTIFNMSAGTISDNTASSEGGGVHDNGTLNMTGGTISGNTGEHGAGVYVGTTGNFVMNGGTIADCTANINGGGVKNDGTLVMTDGTIQGCKALSSESKEGLGGAIYNYGKFTLSGGLIQNNTATRYGGGIHNCGPATFTMNAASIINNEAKIGGGGINSDGNLTISGGTISKNKANTESGGGVRFNANGKEFTMTGGTISECTSAITGGGVYIGDGSNVTTLGGTTKITGNEADGTPNNVYLPDEINLSIGTGSNAPKDGMSVGITTQTPPGQFTSNGTADDVQYFSSDDSTYCIAFNTDHLELATVGIDTVAQNTNTGKLYSNISAAFSEVNSNETIRLLADCTTASTLTVSKTITLDLNGKALQFNGTSGSVIKISADNGKLTLIDSNSTTKHEGYVDSNGLWHLGSGNGTAKTIYGGIITGGTGDAGDETHGGGIDNYGTFTMKAGTIAGNTAQVGGGVYTKSGTFTMDNGVICNNVATKSGGGVWGDMTLNDGEITGNTATGNIAGGVRANNKFTMNGGKVSNNKASAASNGDAGGIYAKTITISGGEISGNVSNKRGGGIYVAQEGTLEITGGTIKNNTAAEHGGGIYSNGTSVTISGTTASVTGNESGAYGGGIYINVNNLTMTGGTITGNNAASNGGGVHIFSTANNPTIGGTAQITGNTMGEESLDSNLNVNKAKNVVIATGDNKPASTMSIGITQGAGDTERPGGQFTTNGTADDVQYFSSDDPNYNVKYNSNGYLEMVKCFTVTFNANDHGTAPDPIKVNIGEKVSKPTDPSEAGLEFGGWFLTPSGEGQWNFNTAVTEDVTLYAKWTYSKYSITYKDKGDTDFSGTHESDYPTSHTYGTNTTLKEATKTGYTFDGWFTSSDCSGSAVTSLGATDFTQDITLYAKWTKNPTPTPDPEPTPEPEPINYKITLGANSIWVVAAGESPVFRSNADFSKFSHVLLDGNELAKKHYKYQSGSTLITLTPEYTATLSVGKHTIEIVSTDGSASTVFYIEETIADTNGEGFTLSTVTMSSAFIGCNILGLSVVFFELKKKKKKVR